MQKAVQWISQNQKKKVPEEMRNQFQDDLILIDTEEKETHKKQIKESKGKKETEAKFKKQIDKLTIKYKE